MIVWLFQAQKPPPSGDKWTKTQHMKTYSAIIHYSHNKRADSRWPVQEVFVHQQSMSPCSIHRDTPQIWEQGVLRVPHRALVCAQWPESTRAIAPLPSLCSSLPSYNIKTVPFCACILGNLRPTMERAWPQHGRSTVPWRGKARAREIERDGKLAGRLGRKRERGNECLSRTDV